MKFPLKPVILWLVVALSAVVGSSCGKPPGAAAPHVTKPPDMAVAFSEDREVTNELGRFTIKIQTLPDLVVTSGKVVACDAFVLDNTPLTTKIPPGKYPVILSIARFATDQRIAYALLQISTNPPVKWQFDRAYGVDSGTGCFADKDAILLLEKRTDRNPDAYNDVIKLMEKTYQPTWSWGNIILDAATGLNQIAFSSGFGDGGYDTFIGYDNDGKIAAVVTDFSILNP
jgi:hypothetical protein